MMTDITEVDDATLVHIAIRKEGPEYRLGVFPMRHGDTIAFHTEKGKPRAGERPREVVWVGHNVTDGMKIVIEAKNPIEDPNSRLLERNRYEIVEGAHLVHSGPVRAPGRPPDDRDRTGLRWAYSITLLDAAGRVLDSIDPDVIIQPDP